VGGFAERTDLADRHRMGAWRGERAKNLSAMHVCESCVTALRASVEVTCALLIDRMRWQVAAVGVAEEEEKLETNSDHFAVLCRGLPAVSEKGQLRRVYTPNAYSQRCDIDDRESA
jgi:hypothetical protein